MKQSGLGQVDPHAHRLWRRSVGSLGETDPEELLDWWLQVPSRKEWKQVGRQHADA